MKKVIRLGLMLVIAGALFAVQSGCKKSDNSGGPSTGVAVYPVTAFVLGPSGAPLGGAVLSLVNPPNQAGTFSTTTDSAGKGTIQSPSGNRTLMARLGVFQATVDVNVAASAGGTIVSTPMHLTQNVTLGKTLVVFASAEQLEAVLHDTAIAYYTYDSTTVDDMRIRADADSVALLNWLTQYHVVFSDCNGGDEYGYPLLARIYGRYVAQGGNIYGGHYNYYNLQFIFPPYYMNSVSDNAADTLKMVNVTLSTAIGYTVIQFPSYNHYITYYDFWGDIPTSNVTVYCVINNSSGASNSPLGIPVIVENRKGSGKYVWTAYHNQDILNDPAHRLVRVVRYFLYYM